MTSATRWVLDSFPDGGYYVEAGAHDGVGDSNTLALEQTGKWNGLCVEPSSAYYGLTQNRKCRTDNRCLWSVDGNVEYRAIDGEAVELSGIPATFRNDGWDREGVAHRDELRQCLTLSSLLHEHTAPNVIEFLSLDTEGSEYEILRVHDFARYRFLFVCVEHNRVQKSKDALYSLLLSHRYRHVREDGNDAWYIFGGITK